MKLKKIGNNLICDDFLEPTIVVAECKNLTDDAIKEFVFHNNFGEDVESLYKNFKHNSSPMTHTLTLKEIFNFLDILENMHSFNIKRRVNNEN